MSDNNKLILRYDMTFQCVSIKLLYYIRILIIDHMEWRSLYVFLLTTNKPFSAFKRFNQTKDILFVIR